MGINYGVDLYGNSDAVMGDMNWSSLGYSIGSSLIMSELGIGQSEEGQQGAAIGSAIGSYFWPCGRRLWLVCGRCVW